LKYFFNFRLSLTPVACFRDSFVTEFNIDTPDLNKYQKNSANSLSMDFEMDTGLSPMGFSSTSFLDGRLDPMDFDLHTYLQQMGNAQELERQLQYGLMSD